MAQRPTGDWDIDPNTTSGTDLANILNRFQDAIDSGNSGASRPSYLAAGGLWVQEGNPMKLMFWTGSEDIEVFNTDDGSGIGAGMVISATEPENSKEGMQWLNSVTAEVFIYDGAVWLEFPGGKDGAPGQDGADGNIADGTEDGIVATWDGTTGQWTPDSSLTIDNTGNVGIGTDSPNRKLTVNNNTGSIVAAQYNRDNSNGGDPKNVIYHYSADGVGRLIYSVDNAGTENHIQSSQDFRLEAGAGGSLKFDTNGDNTRLTIDAVGDATFSGTVSSNTLETNRATNGFFFKANYGDTGLFSSFNHSSGSQLEIVPLGGQMTVNGTVSDNSGPLMSTRGLIKTLSTLRNATKDETTLEGLRDAIGNAIGGLIEEFENQIATMPAEEQASTQEIEQ